MFRFVALAAVLLNVAPARPADRPAPFASSVRPLPTAVSAQLREADVWHRGCPVALSGLRLLSVTYRGFDGRAHPGRLVVNAAATQPLTVAFRRLYALRFPIRHMNVTAAYVRPPRDGDATASFSCRQAVPSPCTGGTGTGTWSMHAYGLAVDVNPVENPYVGCGESRDPHALRYHDRSVHRRGMITGRALQAFRSVGWGWGGAWVGDTQDYMHFSSTGH